MRDDGVWQLRAHTSRQTARGRHAALPRRSLASRDRGGHADERGRGQAQRVRGPGRLREHGERKGPHEHCHHTDYGRSRSASTRSTGTTSRQLDERGFAVTEPLLSGAECEALAELFDGGRFRSTIDMARHRFGEGRYRYFDHPLPGADRRAAQRVLPAPRAGRERLVGACSAVTGRVPARARGAARALPCGGPGAPDAADPALRSGRLECPPPGSLRRRLLPVPGADSSVRARRGLRGRRVRADGAAPARAEPGARRGHATRRLRRLSDPPPSPAGRPRLSQGRPTSRREHRDPRLADGARNHLPDGSRARPISRSRRPARLTEHEQRQREHTDWSSPCARLEAPLPPPGSGCAATSPARPSARG